MNTKSFDCVAMKEAGAERVHDQFAGLTTAQRDVAAIRQELQKSA